jgi:hypothetical protein
VTLDPAPVHPPGLREPLTTGVRHHDLDGAPVVARHDSMVVGVK